MVRTDSRTKWINNWEYWIFAVFTFLVQLPGLTRGFSLDEYKTVMVSRLSWNELLRDRLASGHLPTYFSFIKAWAGFFGEGEAVLRLPSVVLTALAAIFLYLFVRRIGGVSAARWAGLIFAIHQGVAWCGQTARPYGGVMLSTMILYWSAANWWYTREWKWIAIMVGAGLLGIAFMPLAGLLPVSLALATLPAFRQRFSLAWPVVAGCAVAVAVGLLPSALLASSQTKLHASGPMEFPDFPKLIEGLCNSVFGDYRLWGRGGLQYLAGAVLGGAVLIGWMRGKEQYGEGAGAPWRSWVFVWILLPLVTLVLASAVTGEAMVSQQRYRIPSLGGLIVLLAMAMDWMMQRNWKKGFLIGAAGIMVVPTVLSTVFWWRYPGEGVEQVVDAVVAENGGVPEQLAGHARWFRLETPNGELPARELLLERSTKDRNEEFIEGAKLTGSDVEVMHYEKDSDDIEKLRERLASWAGGKPFWLFVYIQRKDALDLVAKNPPAGFRHKTTIRDQDTRAYYFEPNV